MLSRFVIGDLLKTGEAFEEELFAIETIFKSILSGTLETKQNFNIEQPISIFVAAICCHKTKVLEVISHKFWSLESMWIVEKDKTN